MAMGKRKRHRRPTMWVATANFAKTVSHPFYTRLNQLLHEHGFDDFGYFEDVDSERGIASVCGGLVRIVRFSGVRIRRCNTGPPTISRTRCLIGCQIQPRQSDRVACST